MSHSCGNTVIDILQFKDMLLQLEKSYFTLSTIKEVRAHKEKKYWTIMKNNDVKNKGKNKDLKIKTILSSWSFKRKIFSDGGLNKQKERLCAHGGNK